MDDKGHYTFENDTIKVMYRFNGLDGPVSVSIFNKRSEAVLIDWDASALVVNGQSHSFVRHLASVTGEISSNEYRWSKSMASQGGTFNGTAQYAATPASIAPHSYINSSTVALGDFVTAKIDRLNSATEWRTIGGFQYRVKTKKYERNDSPIQVRAYVVYSSALLPNKKSSFDHTFWVSEMALSTFPPTQYPGYASKMNEFHNQKLTDGGAALVFLAGIGLAVLLYPFWAGQ